MDPTEIFQKSRSDSLFTELTRRGLVAVFFDYFFSERPSPEDLLSWFRGRHLKASAGAIHNLISRHGLGYRLGQAREAGDAMVGLLPGDTEARIAQAIKARTLDLVLSEMGSEEALALEKMRRSDGLEREKLRFQRQKTALSARLKRQQLRQDLDKFRHRIKSDTEKALDAFAEEIRGNPAAETALGKLRQAVEAAVA